MKMEPQTPFGLSLSKPWPSSASAAGQVQRFDKLSANGD
jgi:hypothetical protein